MKPANRGVRLIIIVVAMVFVAQTAWLVVALATQKDIAVMQVINVVMVLAAHNSFIKLVKISHKLIS